MEELKYRYTQFFYKFFLYNNSFYFINEIQLFLPLLRYEREVNHGHRSATKTILEGDLPPSSVPVLCISSVQTNTEAMTENISNSHGVDKSTVANVELTDRW